MDKHGPSPKTIQALTYIGALTDRISETQRLLEDHVRFAREQGASWRMIGVALGTSTQAAWERYREDVQAPFKGIQDLLPMDASAAAYRRSVTPGAEHSELIGHADSDDIGG